MGAWMQLQVSPRTASEWKPLGLSQAFLRALTFLRCQPLINFFQTWIQLSQSKNCRVNAFLLCLHTLQTDIFRIEILSSNPFENFYLWAEMYFVCDQMSGQGNPLTQNIKLSQPGMWPLTVTLRCTVMLLLYISHWNSVVQWALPCI